MGQCGFVLIGLFRRLMGLANLSTPSPGPPPLVYANQLAVMYITVIYF